jgi:hypothetical protein
MYIEYVSKVFIHASLWKRILLYVSGILNWSWKAVEIWNVPFLNSYSSSFSTKPNDEFSVRTKMLKNACGMNMFNSEICTPWQGAVRVLQQGENGTHRQSVISEQKKHGYSGTVPTLTLSACIFYSCSVDLLCKETRGMKILKNACAMSTFNSVLSSAHSDKIAGPTLFHIYHGANCRATVRRGWKVTVTDRLWFIARETAVYWTTFECLFAPRKNFPSPAPYLVVLHVFFTLLQASICMPVQEKPGDKVPWMLFHDMLLQAGNACGMRALNSDKAYVNYSECYRIYI